MFTFFEWSAAQVITAKLQQIESEQYGLGLWLAPVAQTVEYRDAALAADDNLAVDQLMDQAISDLLKKHHRPVTLKEALKASAGEPPTALSDSDLPEHVHQNIRKRL